MSLRACATAASKSVLRWGRVAGVPVRSFATDEGAQISVAAGVPEEHLHRKVFIFSPAKAPTQSGTAGLGEWRIEFDSTQKWVNPLIGWTSTGDPLSTVGQAMLNFPSREDAVRFAEKHGWKIEVARAMLPFVAGHSHGHQGY
eukprot:jgi/Mesvir1/4409/Mv04624-RA.1